ncbi:hypothetical protein EVAR_79938_1 [Eumeta japonica]|uniref:Uncharacterized protein n=1 Tax=Eumeta variegata TaxID=151549 RepID=A0A4C1Y5N3_EUMVA|nr:hypothetical protein EVAR_79938_1 [Eumeta japonica]
MNSGVIKNATVSKKILHRHSKSPCKNNETKNFVNQDVKLRQKKLQKADYDIIIKDLKHEIAQLRSQVKQNQDNVGQIENLNEKLSKVCLTEIHALNTTSEVKNSTKEIQDLTKQITLLEKQCEKLQCELSAKQVELSSLEKIIEIRDSLCKDLQNKLTDVEKCLFETCQRLEMVKGHHNLALEANESIRKEYKVETENLKLKLEEEKQALISHYEKEQKNLNSRYEKCIDSLQKDILKEKDEFAYELKQAIKNKESEMKAKLEQIEEAAQEKLRLCEIQFEERSRDAQQLWAQQCEKLDLVKQEIEELKNKLKLSQKQNTTLHKENIFLKNENDSLLVEKTNLIAQANELKDASKNKLIDFENEINRLTVELDKAIKEKIKFETSLLITRDIVHVLTTRLRESDNDIDNLEAKFQALSNVKQNMEEELMNCKIKLNNTVVECHEYKEALAGILKSKAALTKEHNRIMEHNVSLIESLQNVEKEAYRELGTIKNELIGDVEMLKKESTTQIKMLREEVEKKRMLCELATEHAGRATTAAEQSHALLSRAALEISRLETENDRLQQQIEDQQSLVVELSILRQENEELTLNIAKQSSIIEKIKKDMELQQSQTKSPSLHRKIHKVGKENSQTVVSPLRELELMDQTFICRGDSLNESPIGNVAPSTSPMCCPAAFRDAVTVSQLRALPTRHHFFRGTTRGFSTTPKRNNVVEAFCILQSTVTAICPWVTFS